ncbi:hypothetical protein [Novosphingobium olei]|uniref:Uncharacterized protein n=1 Tax=Novosphingobium olei TaxID=2728851 RepID=A0A7Y0BTQ1_9SPHN|nr:hypothetical protein [Novosphingobium olei]NML95716.1 hypothetical protein [Novosphingobium olei]
MKPILTLAAVAAALATTSVASAHDASNGHWDWRGQSPFGPRSIAYPSNRVWVKDNAPAVASCNCSMMKTDCAKRMMGMSRKSHSPSAS